MIVVNKRYYDYDYDNNTIIMFDAEDVGLTLDFDIKGLKDDEKETQNSQSNNKTAPEKLQSQSTETVPDDIIDPKQPTSASNDLDDIKEKEATISKDDDEKEDSDDDMGNISWISSSSPKGLRRIPYALQVAHSYTINKLEVQLTTLVDTRTIQKQKEARAKKLALAQQEAYLKQQQQHAEYMAARHHQHGGHRQYPYPHPHAPHGPHPPHARHPAYPHPAHAHGRHPHPQPHPAYPQRHPYPHPVPHGAHPPHGYHANGQRKQVAPPMSPSGGRGYGHRQNPQYYTTNTNHPVQQQNKSK